MYSNRGGSGRYSRCSKEVIWKEKVVIEVVHCTVVIVDVAKELHIWKEKVVIEVVCRCC